MPPERQLLVRWLRQRSKAVGGMRLLAEKVGGSRSAWADYLSGKRLIPTQLLEALVREAEPPELHERRLSEGRRFLNGARDAEAKSTALPIPASRAEADVIKLQQLVITTQQKEMVAQQARADAQQMVQMLWTMVVDLRARLARAEAERDDALLRSGDDSLRQKLAEAERRREVFQSRLESLESSLDRAVRERLDAEEVAATMTANAEAYRLALQEALARREPQDPGPAEDPAEQQTEQDQHEEWLDAAMEDITSFQDRLADTLKGLREELHMPPSPSEPLDPPVIPAVVLSSKVERNPSSDTVRVVPPDDADNADNDAPRPQSLPAAVVQQQPAETARTVTAATRKRWLPRMRTRPPKASPATAIPKPRHPSSGYDSLRWYYDAVERGPFRWTKPSRAPRRWLARVLLLIFGLSAVALGVYRGVGQHAEMTAYHYAPDCPASAAPGDACIARETGRVAAKNTKKVSSGDGDTTTVYVLTLARASGTTFVDQVDKDLYDTVSNGMTAELTTWKNQIIKVDIAQQTLYYSPDPGSSIALTMLCIVTGMFTTALMLRRKSPAQALFSAIARVPLVVAVTWVTTYLAVQLTNWTQFWLLLSIWFAITAVTLARIGRKEII